jgi:alkylation response protein AidB-like acyl-CoA dehydrogenase
MATDGAAVTLLHVARTFRPRIVAERDHIEAGRRLPENLTRELARAGFFRIFLPAAYEGLDLTPMEAMEVYEELARADASVAWCVCGTETSTGRPRTSRRTLRKKSSPTRT